MARDALKAQGMYAGGGGGDTLRIEGTGVETNKGPHPENVGRDSLRI
jgi:hypothetical protein